MGTFFVGMCFGGVCAFVGGVVGGVVAAQFLPADLQSRVRGLLGAAPTPTPLGSHGAGPISHAELAELARENPAVSQILEAAPAVEPAAVPAFVDAAQVADGRLPFIANPDLDRFLHALKGWRPRSATYGDEQGFGKSMIWHLTNRSGISSSTFEEKPRLFLPFTEARKSAVPDYIFWSRLLVEIKGDVEHGGTSDRALGQMFRYLLAWKSRGPALLVICGYCDPVYKLVIGQYIETWRDRFRMPITVFFASHEDATAVRRELAAPGEA